jgi:hypothetical protein
MRVKTMFADALIVDYREYQAFLKAYEAFLDEKTVGEAEESYWTDMEALEMGANEDAYYRSFR